jgi:Fe-S cluster assembly iron-binding protein IscA
MDMFSQMMAECRWHFGSGQSGILRWLGFKSWVVYDAQDVVPAALRPHYQILLDSGRVVWGAIAQVNNNMFRPGLDDLPGVVVYSADTQFDGHPQDLADVGRAAFALKNSEPFDPELKPVAARMTDEFDMTARLHLPTKLTAGREIFIAATIFHRSRVPGGIMSAGIFPLVIAPEKTEANMVLPLSYWSNALQQRWATLGDTLAALPVTSTARTIALAAEKGPARAAPARHAEATPVYVTSAAAAAFVSIVNQTSSDAEVYFYIGLDTQPERVGRKIAELVLDYNTSHQTCFESNGIPVVVRIDQLDQLRGTVVDYQDSLYGTGFVIRVADDQ